MKRLTHAEHAFEDYRRDLTRRWFFEAVRRSGCHRAAVAAGRIDRHCGGFGAGRRRSTCAAETPFPAKAKRVIYLFMAGAPSHLELFDYKPQLAKFSGTLPPAELLKGYRAAFINPSSTLLGPKFKFAKHGKSGIEVSEPCRTSPEVADDHRRSSSRCRPTRSTTRRRRSSMNTGSQQFGAELRRLDHLRARQRVAGPAGLRGVQHRQQGHERRSVELGPGLPAHAVHSGTLFRTGGDPHPAPRQSEGRRTRRLQKDSLDVINRLNRQHLDAVG
jgi:hypothetical protein